MAVPSLHRRLHLILLTAAWLLPAACQDEAPPEIPLSAHAQAVLADPTRLTSAGDQGAPTGDADAVAVGAAEPGSAPTATAADVAPPAAAEPPAAGAGAGQPSPAPAPAPAAPPEPAAPPAPRPVETPAPPAAVDDAPADDPPVAAMVAAPTRKPAATAPADRAVKPALAKPPREPKAASPPSRDAAAAEPDRGPPPEAAGVDPSLDATDLYYQGKRQLQAGDRDGAIRSLTASLARRSSDRTRAALGQALFDAGRYADAERVLRGAPTFADALLLLAQLYQHRGKSSEARRTYTAFLTHHPDHPRAEWVRSLLRTL